MPQIFYCDMKNFEHLYEECIFLLPEKRKEKAERIINKNEALLSAVSGLMIKKVLGITDDDLIFYNEHGKPFLKKGPFFNVSHSRRYAVLAVSEDEIGIDVEMHQNPNERLMERCFTEDEKAFAKLSTEKFLRIWTAKEAVLKFLGTGFSFSSKNFSVLPLSEEHEIKGRKMRFFCGNINEAPFTAAFCGKDDDFKILEFQPEDLIY
ncbi:MAG: 4'-phosphopantetheinyl transferase superfamily protein [Oscillospiraceae bacterium]|nr:4'-phosphopantetheinyl transferase superfamily protein [Oscillospiraceae bacterium]